MLVSKNGITHQIEERRLPEFKEKGFAAAEEKPAEIKAPVIEEKPKRKTAKTEGGN